MHTYEANWTSLKQHSTPQWLREDKFGIYTHWGVYSVPACGPNGTWYAHNMYRKGNSQYEYHEKTYGPAAEFGYKDFIPMFTAEKFDATEWAALFKASGARFAGPVAEHHDGFSMWNSKINGWNAFNMGPKRDIVGELSSAMRAEDMRFIIALHHAEQWWFYPHWRTDCDVSDPEFSGLYGPLHDVDISTKGAIPHERFREWFWQDRPTVDFLNFWRSKAHELIDGYQPDLIWFDFGINFVPEFYRQELLAYFYNQESAWQKEVAVTYKGHDLAVGSALIDYELGRMDELTYYDWITDTSVDDQGAWSYVPDAAFKEVSTLIHNLVDNVSKNGYLLLNVGPRPDGSIPQGAKTCLYGMGDWLSVNGEAIFGTIPWLSYGEGPTKMETRGMFSERNEVKYTSLDYRFTCRDNCLYAICLGWPEKAAVIRSMKKLYPGEIASVEMLGTDEKLNWSHAENGLEIRMPASRPCDHATVFKIIRKNPF